VKSRKNILGKTKGDVMSVTKERKKKKVFSWNQK